MLAIIVLDLIKENWWQTQCLFRKYLLSLRAYSLPGAIAYQSLQQFWNKGTTIIFILKMRKLKLNKWNILEDRINIAWWLFGCEHWVSKSIQNDTQFPSVNNWLHDYASHRNEITEGGAEFEGGKSRTILGQPSTLTFRCLQEMPSCH